MPAFKWRVTASTPCGPQPRYEEHSNADRGPLDFCCLRCSLPLHGRGPEPLIDIMRSGLGRRAGMLCRTGTTSTTSSGAGQTRGRSEPSAVAGSPRSSPSAADDWGTLSAGSWRRARGLVDPSRLGGARSDSSTRERRGNWRAGILSARTILHRDFDPREPGAHAPRLTTMRLREWAGAGIVMRCVTAGALLVVPVGCGDPYEEDGLEIDGHVELRPGDAIIGVSELYELGSACDGNSTTANVSTEVRRYFSAAASDYRAGAEVLLKDREGSAVGSGKLDEGKWVGLPAERNVQDHVCRMPFTAGVFVSDVYEVQIGPATTTVSTFITAGEEHSPLRLVPDVG